jgi:hypothetical protein
LCNLCNNFCLCHIVYFFKISYSIMSIIHF